jgi:hypothetical protein
MLRFHPSVLVRYCADERAGVERRRIQQQEGTR